MAAQSSDTSRVEGNWHRRLWRLAGPIIISNLSVPLLGIADTAVMGHLPDPAYLGAVAIGALIFSYVYWGFGFLRMSTTGLTAQAWGRDDGVEVRAILLRAGIIAAVLGGLLLLLQIPIRLVGLSMLSASSDVEELAAIYIQIRIWGAPATLLNYVILGWLLGTQDARTPLFLQLWANGVNIILDLVFVLGFGWGIEGVAVATLIAEVSGAAIGVILVYRRVRARTSPLQAGERLFTWSGIRALVALNGDIFIRTLCLITAFAYFTNQGALLGTITLAANAVLLNFMSFAAHGLDGFAHAAEALVGGSVGKKDRRGFLAASKVAFLWGGIVAVLCSMVFFAFGHPIVNLMTGIEEVRLDAYLHLGWAAFMPVLAVWAFVFDGIFLGATRSAALRNAMILSLGGYLLINPWLRDAYDNHGLWAALSIFMALRGVTLAFAFPKLVKSVGPSGPP